MSRGALTWFKIIESASVEAIDYWTNFSMKFLKSKILLEFGNILGMFGKLTMSQI
jgi:hypothetical protein